MPLKCYVPKKFQRESLLIIEQANLIIEEYQQEALILTLRQLYYQFVAKDWIANKTAEYHRLGSIINDARLAGLIDWDSIEDRSRNLQKLTHWIDPGEIVSAAARSFRLDHWISQYWQPEVWIEKEALTGVIEGVCRDLDTPYFACRGYVSQSEMWRASQRLKGYAELGRTPVIIYLGDHDPSGIDMTRDIFDRQQLFIGEVKVDRIALTMAQIKKYSPPPNPAKVTDSRFSEYSLKYGDDSWELDALKPDILQRLVRSNILKYRDKDIYLSILSKENKYLETLKNIEMNWESL